MARLIVKWEVRNDNNETTNSGEIDNIALENEGEETLEFDTRIIGGVHTLEHVGTRPRDRE